jgi:hypothetical protein
MSVRRWRTALISVALAGVLLATLIVLFTGDATVRGLVVDADGNPLGDCFLEETYRGPFPAEVTDEGNLTSEDGSFEFDVPAGRNAVRARCDDASSATKWLLLIRGGEKAVRLVVAD